MFIFEVIVSSANGIMTANHRLLVAAISLEDDYGLKQWSESQLVVNAWQKNADVFGLDGFKDKYPDNNTVRVALCGAKGLIHKGFLEKIAPKTYRLSKTGREIAKGLSNGHKPVALHAVGFVRATPPCLLSSRLEGIANKLLQSRVFRYWQAKQKERICFDIALEFWCTSHGSTDAMINKDIERTSKEIAELLACVSEKEHSLRSGQILRATDVAAMVDCQIWLREAFARRIERMAS